MRTKRSRSKRPRRNKELHYVDQERAASSSFPSNPHPHCQQGVARLTVNRTNLHIYASVISGDGSKVLASCFHGNEADVRKSLGGSGKGGNAAAAQAIGKRIAEKAKAAGVEKVAFDRAGFAYHGRVKALADAAREAGCSSKRIGITNG
jgi:large subunit ribosomal protein L18